jgi:hypothetical protein
VAAPAAGVPHPGQGCTSLLFAPLLQHADMSEREVEATVHDYQAAIAPLPELRRQDDGQPPAERQQPMGNAAEEAEEQQQEPPRRRRGLEGEGEASSSEAVRLLAAAKRFVGVSLCCPPASSQQPTDATRLPLSTPLHPGSAPPLPPRAAAHRCWPPRMRACAPCQRRRCPWAPPCSYPTTSPPAR